MRLRFDPYLSGILGFWVSIVATAGGVALLSTEPNFQIAVCALGPFLCGRGVQLFRGLPRMILNATMSSSPIFLLLCYGLIEKFMFIPGGLGVVIGTHLIINLILFHLLSTKVFSEDGRE